MSLALAEVGMRAGDLGAASGFYEAVLGLRALHRADRVLLRTQRGASARLALYPASGETPALAGGAAVAGPRLVLVYLVADVDRVAERVQRAGADVVGGPLPYAIPGRGEAVGMTCLDPNGVLLDFTAFPGGPTPADPSVVRRVTIPVPRGTFSSSLRFYCDRLGLSVFYDGVITASGDSLLGVPGLVTTRVVSLQGGTDTTGMVGILEYHEPDIDPPPFRCAGAEAPLVLRFGDTGEPTRLWDPHGVAVDVLA